MKAELIVDAPIIDKKKIWIKKIEKPYFDHPFHYHQVCELIWIEKGHGKLIAGDYVGNFSEGDLILQNAGLPHLYRSDPIFYDEKQRLVTKVTATYFSSSFVPNMIDDTVCVSLYKDALAKAERGLRFYGQTKKNAIELIKKMINSVGLEQLGYFLQVIHLIIHSKEFKFMAGASYKNNFSEGDVNRFNEVYQFLLQNFSQEIMLSEIAGICNMTSNSFCRFFKAKTQKTFTRFLNEIRIGQACKLLQNEEYPIKDIYYECGYNSPVNFFKFFKLITGKTPKGYRENIKKMGTTSN
ncbi:MAG: AraC family transcriptional regulator [Ginsengibacter sp.]